MINSNTMNTAAVSDTTWKLRVNPKSSHHKEIGFYFLDFIPIWDGEFSRIL